MTASNNDNSMRCAGWE